MQAQRDTKEWIRAVSRHLNLTASQLAAAAGVAPSTLTRYLNDASGVIGISQKTLDAVAEFSGVRPHAFPGRRPPGMGEQDAIAWDAKAAPDDPLAASVSMWTRGANGRDAWVMKGWALDMSGILPGDVMIVDQNRRAKSGDVVCAQIADWQTGRAETVFRLYEAPWLMTHSAKLGAVRPSQVDDDEVAIRGVVVAVLRARN